jgi:superfamily II DNA or RNA helicase
VLQLEDLKRGARITGIVPQGAVTVVDVHWMGATAVELTYKTPTGQVANQLLYRDSEPTLALVTAGVPWTFDSDGALFRLVSEAHRIRLAYLFDPWLALSTSLVEPLPHQITAVYEQMLPRQPLRYLLADDPGAGKTIMTGLLMKELHVRGDLQRCLVVCPGMLAEQWQDELWDKFHLLFEILTTEQLEAARSGNWFLDHDLVIARLDKLSRDDAVQAQLAQTDWDLIVCDEAHKLSATFFGGEVRYTRRYRLGQLLARLARHFLLLTATPHNGKEEDFQLFLALLDGDRFEGRFRDGVHLVDTSDLMRRLTKEQLLTFDCTPLFPERRAATVTYQLSPPEAHLYQRVTAYVREEFNRAEALESEGRKGTVGFALTILQRRLASSPEAIYQSLRRRRERLARRLQEEQLLARGAAARGEVLRTLPMLVTEDMEDLDDAPQAELEAMEEAILDQATASRTLAELAAEIAILTELEALALRVRRSEQDRKWEELRTLLLDAAPMFDAQGHRRKLVIFTEHRDTLAYVTERIRTLLGQADAVVTIHGGLGREERRTVQERFTQDKDVHILVATDAAGEGINLQRAHLMVNYDLPWNPNRLEQRFGRIHRIGQTEVCHLWNLVAEETREGDVFARLLKKLEVEREALGGAVFDVLGKVFQGTELRRLLIEAIRYGDRPEVRARLTQQVEQALDTKRLRSLIAEHALAQDTMDARRVLQIREAMERAEARRLQPHFIASFFLEAFGQLGGTIREREPRRYEITHVPVVVRQRDRLIGRRAPVLPRYERITFHKELISVPGKPLAAFVCPGHPLLDAVTDVLLERYRELLTRGALLVAPEDTGTDIRALFYLEHAVQDARTDRNGQRRVVSRQLQFVEIDHQGHARAAGAAPYLDYRPATAAEAARLRPLLEADWLRQDLDATVRAFAVETLVPRHVEEVRTRRDQLIRTTMAAVKDRLTKEITYWDHRAEDLKAQEQAGRQPRMNWLQARARADELQARLARRLAELEQERQLAALPPVVVGGALVVPEGLLASLAGEAPAEPAALARETQRVEALAMQAVLRTEHQLGYVPRDVSREHCGWDIESQDPVTGRLRFIEVKGRVQGARTVTVTKNEILASLNKPEAFLLALVEVAGDVTTCRYLRGPFQREPDFGVTSVNYDLAELWARAEEPA